MIEKNGKLFENSVRKAAEKYPELVTKVEGEGMLLSLHFKSVEVAAAFASKVSEHSVDTSAQLYKPHCPPAVLFKPPVISSEKTLMFICDTISDTLENM